MPSPSRLTARPCRHYLSPMSRLLIVANRLPVTVRPTPVGVEVERSTGGLATGMSRPH